MSRPQHPSKQSPGPATVATVKGQNRPPRRCFRGAGARSILSCQRDCAEVSKGLHSTGSFLVREQPTLSGGCSR
jgi:hypothetical protein